MKKNWKNKNSQNKFNPDLSEIRRVKSKSNEKKSALYNIETLCRA